MIQMLYLDSNITLLISKNRIMWTRQDNLSKIIRQKSKINWRDYERAMFNELYYRYQSSEYIVLPDYKEVEGLITGDKRQIDVVVFDRQNLSRPFIMVESKFYARKLNVKDVEAFIGMQQDIGSENAFMVAPLGFSKMAQRRVKGTNIKLLTLPEIEAERLSWRDTVRAVFSIGDETFHSEMGDAIHIFNTTYSYNDLNELMEPLPFEEWDTLFHIYRRVNEEKCREALKGFAYYHYDSGWKFNCVRLLNEFGWLTQEFVDMLFEEKQVDYDLWFYLNESGYCKN